MKKNRVSAAKKLVFNWEFAEGRIWRLMFSVALTAGIFALIWSVFQIRISSSFSADPPRLEKAQLLLFDEQDQGFASFLRKTDLPSLGSDDLLTEIPPVESLLNRLGLVEEKKENLTLYPAAQIQQNLAWPAEELSLVYPPLPSFSEVPVQSSPSVELKWQVRLTDQKGVLKEEVLAWDGALPLSRHLKWSVVVDSSKDLVFAASLSEVNQSIEQELRKIINQWVVSSAQQASQGIVEIVFERRDS